jgi:molybdopterin-guanine dinucleotide biosynthesis protein A
VLVVGCDMPLLSERLLDAMIKLPSTADAIVPRRAIVHARQRSGATWEPLHAIYRDTCLPAIERRIALGESRVVGFFDDVRVQALDELWMKSYDPSLLSLTNTNTPNEFTAALETIGTPGVAREETSG